MSLLITGCVKTSLDTELFLSYTAEQANRGKSIYLEHCVLCHGTNLLNAQFGAPLKGSFFQSRWKDRNAAELFTITRVTMPPDNPMSLSNRGYSDVIAYILQANAIEAGTGELPYEQEKLLNLKLPW